MAVMWIDEDSSLADRRRWDRFSPDGQTSVTLAAGGRTYDCELLDLSLGGARLRVSEPVPDDDNVVLQHRIGGLFFACATWRRGDEIGVRFRVPEQTREHALQCASVLLYGDDEPGILPPGGSRSEGAQAQS